jgi:hypothetical protein
MHQKMPTPSETMIQLWNCILKLGGNLKFWVESIQSNIQSDFQRHYIHADWIIVSSLDIVTMMAEMGDCSNLLWTCGSVAYPSHQHVPVHIQIDLVSVNTTNATPHENKMLGIFQ